MRKKIIINVGVLLQKRKQLGLPHTQRWFAREMERSESMVSDYSNNKVNSVDLGILADMLATLNKGMPSDQQFTIEDFFTEIEESPEVMAVALPG